jgi:pimeloyl-ACP methyl ester carboxylesterase
MYKLPAELDASLEKLARLVKADSRIGKSVPDLVKLFVGLQERLAKSPLGILVTDPVDGRKVEVSFGPYGLQFLLIRDLGDTSDIPVLPKLLYQIERGETELLQRYLQKRYSQMRTMNAMSVMMRAASGATAKRWKTIVRQMKTSVFGASRLVVPREMAEAIGAPDLGNKFREPVKSTVRALFVSGTLDAHTPPEQAERVKKGFSNSTHLIIENAGHEDLMTNRDVQQAVVRFFKGQLLKDARIKAPPIRFAPVK